MSLEFPEGEDLREKYNSAYGGDFNYLGAIGIETQGEPQRIYPIYKQLESIDFPNKIIMTYNGSRLIGFVSKWKLIGSEQNVH